MAMWRAASATESDTADVKTANENEPLFHAAPAGAVLARGSWRLAAGATGALLVVAVVAAALRFPIEGDAPECEGNSCRARSGHLDGVLMMKKNTMQLDDCPAGYEGTEANIKGAGKAWTFGNLTDCASTCDNREGCKGFEFHDKNGKCGTYLDGYVLGGKQNHRWLTCIKEDVVPTGMPTPTPPAPAATPASPATPPAPEATPPPPATPPAPAATPASPATPPAPEATPAPLVTPPAPAATPASPATPLTPVVTLAASDGAVDDMFGESVSISSDGTRVVVGAGNSDSAYVFDVTTGDQVAKLVPEDTTNYDRFGFSVSISSDGTLAVVGAPGRGSAYLFDTGELEAVWEAPDIAIDFGGSVSISSDGTLVVVGAPGDFSRSVSGLAYVFEVATGDQLAKLAEPDGAVGDFFGFSVSMSSDGTRVVVGAPGDSRGVASGSAYVFDVYTGDHLAKLALPDRAGRDYFGVSVSMSSDGTRVVVGASGEDWTGSAYVFDVATGGQVAKLAAPDRAGDRFGYSVSMSSDGTRVVVGAEYSYNETGSAYVFDVATGDQVAQLATPDVADSDYISCVSISSDGTRVVVGADHSDDEISSAYVFDVATGD